MHTILASCIIKKDWKKENTRSNLKKLEKEMSENEHTRHSRETD